MATSRVKDRPHGGGDDSDDIPPKPEPPPPASGPAIALQVRNDAGANAGCLPADQAETVRRTIEEEFRRQFPDADVRGACVRTHDGVSATTVGIWPQPSIPGGDEARDRGLRQVRAIRSSDTIAIFVEAGFIRSRVSQQFDAIPKRYSGRGTPASDGLIQLTHARLNFVPLSTIDGRLDLEISGVDERPVPDVTFTIRYPDVLQLNVGTKAIESHSLEPQRSDSVGFLNITTTILSAVLAVVFPPSAFLTKGVLSALLQQPDGPPQQPGVGSAIVKSFFPRAVLIPDGLKLELSYSRLEINDEGIVGAGVPIKKPRSPSCRILGALRLEVDFRQETLSEDYFIAANDMRGDLAVEWSGDGVTPSNSLPNTTITFALSGQRVGAVQKFDLHARAVDADGLPATAVREIEIHFVKADDEGLPTHRRGNP